MQSLVSQAPAAPPACDPLINPAADVVAFATDLEQQLEHGVDALVDRVFAAVASWQVLPGAVAGAADADPFGVCDPRVDPLRGLGQGFAQRSSCFHASQTSGC